MTTTTTTTTKRPRGRTPLTNQSFIDRVKQLQPNLILLTPYVKGNEYVEYHCTQCNNKSKIIPRGLLYYGHGCNKCSVTGGGIGKLNSSSMEKLIGRKKLKDSPVAKLYLIEMTSKIVPDAKPFYKIGVTVQTLAQRFMNVRCVSNCDIKRIASIESTDHANLVAMEKFFVSQYKDLRVKFDAKWLGSGECFNFDDSSIPLQLLKDIVNGFDKMAGKRSNTEITLYDEDGSPVKVETKRKYAGNHKNNRIKKDV